MFFHWIEVQGYNLVLKIAIPLDLMDEGNDLVKFHPVYRLQAIPKVPLLLSVRSMLEKVLPFYFKPIIELFRVPGFW